MATAVSVSALAETAMTPARKPSLSCARRDLDFQYQLNVLRLSVCYPDNSRIQTISQKVEHVKLFKWTLWQKKVAAT